MGRVGGGVLVGRVEAGVVADPLPPEPGVTSGVVDGVLDEAALGLTVDIALVRWSPHGSISGGVGWPPTRNIPIIPDEKRENPANAPNA